MMKRFLAILLCLMMVCALVACNNNGTPNNGTNGNNNGTNNGGTDNGSTNNGGTTAPGVNGTAARYGLGMTVESTVSPAEDDNDGKAEAGVTCCALALDAEGRIVSVTFDCVEATATYGSNGSNLTMPESFTSKKELGDAYKMKEYSSIGKEWYEQVNALEAYCIGKTVSDVSSMQMKEVDGRQNIPAVAELTSSCTISCDQFIAALKKAEANAR